MNHAEGDLGTGQLRQMAARGHSSNCPNRAEGGEADSLPFLASRVLPQAAFFLTRLCEYISPDDSLNIDIFAKAMAYAHLYKSQGISVDEIPYGEISATIYRHKFPREAFRNLADHGAVITKSYPGVFYVQVISHDLRIIDL